MLLFVGDGPYRNKTGTFMLNAFSKIFHSKRWRQAAMGYFGHMWELYSFWAFVPIILGLYAATAKSHLNISLLSFLVIASGAIGCIAGGFLSQKMGSAKVAAGCLLISGTCCFLSPLLFILPLPIFLFIMFIWGLTVCPDSPQFSTLVAQYAPDHLRGTALTIYNSIGFLITTISLYVVDRLYNSNTWLGKENTFLALGLGALVGLPGMIKLIRSK